MVVIEEEPLTENIISVHVPTQKNDRLITNFVNRSNTNKFLDRDIVITRYVFYEVILNIRLEM